MHTPQTILCEQNFLDRQNLLCRDGINLQVCKWKVHKVGRTAIIITDLVEKSLRQSSYKICFECAYFILWWMLLGSKAHGEFAILGRQCTEFFWLMTLLFSFYSVGGMMTKQKYITGLQIKGNVMR